MVLPWELTNIRYEWTKSHLLYYHISCMYTTLDDSHRTGTTEIVQANKSFKENIEDGKEMKIWDQTMYL